MPITRLNHFEAPKGGGDKLHDFLQSVSDIVKTLPRCNSVRLLRSAEDRDQFAIVEEWESIEAHQAAASAIPPEKMKQAMALLAKPATWSE